MKRNPPGTPGQLDRTGEARRSPGRAGRYRRPPRADNWPLCRCDRRGDRSRRAARIRGAPSRRWEASRPPALSARSWRWRSITTVPASRPFAQRPSARLAARLDPRPRGCLHDRHSRRPGGAWTKAGTIPADLGERIYLDVERARGLTWIEVLRELTYRPDAEAAISAYLHFRPIPIFFEAREQSCRGHPVPPRGPQGPPRRQAAPRGNRGTAQGHLGGGRVGSLRRRRRRHGEGGMAGGARGPGAV